MGIARAGFRHELLVEWNKDAANTLRANERILGLDSVDVIQEVDVASFDYGTVSEGIDLLAGGPPCQPFSVGGKHLGDRDRRDMFAQTVKAVRELKPKAVLLENVRGLARPRFSDYLEYILDSLSLPEVVAFPGENWKEHRERIRWEKAFSRDTLRYRVDSHVVNAADFGIPQKRDRLFIVAWREDCQVSWVAPRATHSRSRLYWDQWVSEEYWDRHNVELRLRPAPGEDSERKAKRLRVVDIEKLDPWKTVRDSIGDLPQLYEGAAVPIDCDHYLNPGAKSYRGHTGSPLDFPAKTLKAGDHGVPGGENTLRIKEGTVRYFSIREAARLQTFPDTFQITGSWTEGMRQMGNAVPAALSEAFAAAIAEAIREG